MNYIDEVKRRLSKEIKVNNNLLDLYCLLVLTKGQNTTLKDVHDAWAFDKNRTFPEHRSLVPFNELSYEVQMKDLPFLNAIKKVAKEVNKN